MRKIFKVRNFSKCVVTNVPQLLWYETSEEPWLSYLSNWAVTTIFYDLGLSELGFDHPTFRMQSVFDPVTLTLVFYYLFSKFVHLAWLVKVGIQYIIQKYDIMIRYACAIRMIRLLIFLLSFLSCRSGESNLNVFFGSIKIQKLTNNK